MAPGTGAASSGKSRGSWFVALSSSVPFAASTGRLEDLAVDPNASRYSSSRRPGEDAGTPVDLLLDPVDQVLDLRRPRSQRPPRHVDVERPAVGEPDPAVRAVLEAADRDPGRRRRSAATPRSGSRRPAPVARLTGRIVRATSPLTTTSIRSSGTAPSPSPASRYSRAAASVRLETVPRVVAVEGHEEHRAGRDEAPARVQALEPGGRVEAPVEPDVHPAEAQRDRVDARGRPGRRPQPEPAVEQGVVVLGTRSRSSPAR